MVKMKTYTKVYPKRRKCLIDPLSRAYRQYEIIEREEKSKNRKYYDTRPELRISF